MKKNFEKRAGQGEGRERADSGEGTKKGRGEKTARTEGVRGRGREEEGGDRGDRGERKAGGGRTPRKPKRRGAATVAWRARRCAAFDFGCLVGFRLLLQTRICAEWT